LRDGIVLVSQVAQRGQRGRRALLHKQFFAARLRVRPKRCAQAAREGGRVAVAQLRPGRRGVADRVRARVCGGARAGRRRRPAVGLRAAEAGGRRSAGGAGAAAAAPRLGIS